MRNIKRRAPTLTGTGGTKTLTPQRYNSTLVTLVIEKAPRKAGSNLLMYVPRSTRAMASDKPVAKLKLAINTIR